MIENERKTVVEVCAFCGVENEMVWDIDELGYEAFCPVCGNKMMLCDECMHSEDEMNENGNHCDYGEHEDGSVRCFRCIENKKKCADEITVTVKVKEEESEDSYLKITLPEGREIKEFEKHFEMAVKYAQFEFYNDDDKNEYDEMFDEMAEVRDLMNGEESFITYLEKRGYKVKCFSFDYEFEW